jgi:hypothetical protein
MAKALLPEPPELPRVYVRTLYAGSQAVKRKGIVAKGWDVLQKFQKAITLASQGPIALPREGRHGRS